MSIIKFDDLVQIGEVREKILSLIHTTDIPEYIIEEMLEPVEKILIEEGVNLKETNY